MIEELIKALEKKGLNDVRAIVKDLEKGGAITPIHVSKYLGREEVLTRVATTTMSSTRIIEDVAFVYCIGRKTLERTLIY